MNDLHTSLNETPHMCVVWDLDKESGFLFGRIILWRPFFLLYAEYDLSMDLSFL